jgi:hypothetical protein
VVDSRYLTKVLTTQGVWNWRPVRWEGGFNELCLGHVVVQLMCFVICVCVFVIYIYIHFCCLCSVCVLIFIVLCIFIFVCTSVGLLPPGESPIAVSKLVIGGYAVAQLVETLHYKPEERGFDS